MVGEIADLALDVPPPAGVELRQVTDRQGVDALVRVHDEVFGEDHAALGAELLARLARRPPTVAAVIAVAGDTPICAGRVEFHSGHRRSPVSGVAVPSPPGEAAASSARLVAYRAALACGQGLPLPAGRRLAGKPADPPAPRLRRARHHDPVPPPRLRGVEPSRESAGLRAGRGSPPATLPPPTHEGSTRNDICAPRRDDRLRHGRRLRGRPVPDDQPRRRRRAAGRHGPRPRGRVPRVGDAAARRDQRPAAHHLRGRRRRARRHQGVGAGDRVGARRRGRVEGRRPQRALRRLQPVRGGDRGRLDRLCRADDPEEAPRRRVPQRAELL